MRKFNIWPKIKVFIILFTLNFNLITAQEYLDEKHRLELQQREIDQKMHDDYHNKIKVQSGTEYIEKTLGREEEIQAQQLGANSLGTGLAAEAVADRNNEGPNILQNDIEDKFGINNPLVWILITIILLTIIVSISRKKNGKV